MPNILANKIIGNIPHKVTSVSYHDVRHIKNKVAMIETTDLNIIDILVDRPS